MNKKHKSLLLRFDRILSQDLLRQVLILVGVLFVIFILSFLLLSVTGSGWKEYCAESHISKWVFPLYLLIDGNAFHDFCSSERIGALPVLFACVIYVVGVIIFTGMIISVMTNMIEQRVKSYREGHIHYLESGHYIIMGYDDMVPSFIRHIFDNDSKAYVLILTAARVPYIKEQLLKSFSKEKMEHIIINYAHRTTTDSYHDIHLESAEQIFIVGLRTLPAHDAINVECVDCVCRYLEQKKCSTHPKTITCVFKDLDTYAAFKTSEIFGRVRELGIEFVPYNFFTGWAKQVFVKRFYNDVDNRQIRYEYPSVYGNGIAPDDDKFVHLVFVGTTNFAVAFAMEAAHVLHFPNFNHNQQLKTRITFIDINADIEKDEFITRNRHFFEVQSYRYQDLTDGAKDDSVVVCPNSFFGTNGDFLDVQFEFIKGNIFSKKVQNEIRKWATNEEEKQYLSIFLAMENQRSNFLMGMNMPDEVYDNEIPVFIRQDRSDNFVTNLREADTKRFTYYTIDEKGLIRAKDRTARYGHIYPFGMNETAYCADDKSVKRAKLINYLYSTSNNNKFQGLLVLNSMPVDSIWKKAEELWNDSGFSVALKWSNLYSSYAIRTKLATLRAMRGLALNDTSLDTQPLSKEEIEELALVEHNRWNVEKLLMGFRKPHPDEDMFNVHGNSEKAKQLKKNKQLFIHYDIRPFKDLDEIMELDKEFARYIPWIMEMTEK